MRATLAILALVLVSCVSSISAVSSRTDFVIASGTHGRLAGTEDVGSRRAPWIEVASDRETFVRHWNQFVPGEPGKSVEEIAFERELAVFLLLGPQQTGGYAIEPIDVNVDGTIVKVRAKLVQPMKPEDFTAQVISAPYAVVRAPAIPFDRIEWIDADGRLLASRSAK